MTRNHKVTGRAFSMPAGLAICTCISLGLMLVLSVLLARLISTEKLEWDKAGYGIILILLITATIGTKLSCLMIKRRKLMTCAFAGALYWISLLLITALFFDGQYSGVGISALIILCGSAMVYLQELRGERGQNKSMRRGKPKRQRL